MLSLPRLPRLATSTSSFGSQSNHKLDDAESEETGANLGALQMAVMIAMPSPCHAPLADGELKEHEIGVAVIPWEYTLDQE